jgi:tetratricopeptide (TPR) repeat protein
MASIAHGKRLLGKAPYAVLAAWLGVWAVSAAAAADSASVTDKLKELNTVTGNEPLEGALKGLLEKKGDAKELIAAALPLAKDNKKEALSYNAALALAFVASERKDLAAGEAFFRVCMDKAAKLESPRKLAQSYGGLIELYFENKKYDASARVCQELLELKTGDQKPRIVLLADTTRFGEADFKEEDGYDAAEDLRPGVHRLLIQAVSKQGKYDEALKYVDNLITAKDQWRDRQLKGWVLREAGKFEEAAKTYEDVIDRIAKDKKLEPEEKELYQERDRYLLSNIFVEMGKIDLATDQLQQLLAKKPDDPGYNNDLGYILADHGMKLEEAEKMIRKALELDRKKRAANPKLDPDDDHDNGAYLDSLGWVLFKRGKLAEAKKYLLEAVQDKASQHIEIFDHLGDVHLALGEKAEAVAAWRKGLEHAGEGRRELERKAMVEKKIEENK